MRTKRNTEDIKAYPITISELRKLLEDHDQFNDAKDTPYRDEIIRLVRKDLPNVIKIIVRFNCEYDDNYYELHRPIAIGLDEELNETMLDLHEALDLPYEVREQLEDYTIDLKKEKETVIEGLFMDLGHYESKFGPVVDQNDSENDFSDAAEQLRRENLLNMQIKEKPSDKFYFD